MKRDKKIYLFYPLALMKETLESMGTKTEGLDPSEVVSWFCLLSPGKWQYAILAIPGESPATMKGVVLLDADDLYQLLGDE